METVTQSAFELGDWQVSPDQGVISRDGVTVKLEPRAMDVLAYLATHPGKVVSRRDLEQDVWHGALVSDDALTSSVMKLRKALGDDAKTPRYIVTVPKRGYRLLAPVAPSHAAAKAPAGTVESARASHRYTRQDRVKVAVLVVGLAAAAALVWAVLTILSAAAPDSPTHPAGDAAGPPPSIVVLPFENLSEDPLRERFADGMTEDLITDLSGLSGLRVIASNTSFSYKGRQVDPKHVGAELEVDFVLGGSVRRRGDSLRVNARLVDTKNLFQVWANRYDRPTHQTFAVQDELTKHIVEEEPSSHTRGSHDGGRQTADRRT